MWIIVQLTVLLIVCLALIIYSGVRLSFYADKLAEKTKLGRTLVGVILLAGVTSLPELTTGIVSVTITETPDIAIGAILGSCVFNIAILAMLDPLSKHGPLLSRADSNHILATVFGVIMMSAVLIGQMLTPVLPALFHIGIYSLVLIALYFTCMKLTKSYIKANIPSVIVPGKVDEKTVSLRFIIRQFIKNSVIIVLAASALPFAGEQLSEIAGIGQTFIGSVLIAIITSSPEIVVSVAAIRINAVDLAIGNLLGSNIFNVFIIAVDDLFYLPGPILQHIVPSHIFSGIIAIAMSAIVILALVTRSQTRRFFFSNVSWIILLLYSFYISILYYLTEQ